MKSANICIGLIPIAIRRWKRAKMGINPCLIGANFTPTWNQNLQNLKAFGKSLNPPRKKSQRAKH